ncbi:MAG: hypothetical protein AAF705_21685, partial [Bacteroidota bacterium]
RTIVISLLDKIEKGECGKFPSPNGLIDTCNPRGRFYIPENLLKEQHYSIIFKIRNSEIFASLEVKDDSYRFDFPANEIITNSEIIIYPIPKDLLFGNLVFTGIEHTAQAENFFSKLEALGLTETRVPNLPYRHLRVEDDGKPRDRHWGQDHHSLGFLYKMESDFRTIFELAKSHFEESEIDMYLHSSNGDEARLSKKSGIIVVYAE